MEKFTAQFSSLIFLTQKKVWRNLEKIWSPKYFSASIFPTIKMGLKEFGKKIEANQSNLNFENVALIFQVQEIFEFKNLPHAPHMDFFSSPSYVYNLK